MKYWLMEGVDGFILSRPELLVEGAADDAEGWHHQAASAEFVAAVRGAFDEVAADTGKASLFLFFGSAFSEPKV